VSVVTYPPLAGVPLTVAGRDLLLPRVVQDDKRIWGVWSAAQTVAEARALEACAAPPGREPTPERPMSREDFYRTLDAATTRATSGQCGWNEPAGAARRSTDEGLAYMAWVCLRRANPPADPKDPGVSFADVLAVPADALFAAFQQANADPNPPARANGPGTPTAGTGDSSGPT
jgi:hypothetical protein